MIKLVRGTLLAALLFAPIHASAQTLVLEYYHLDALGSVRVVTDQNRTVVRQHDFFPFGEEVPPQALGGDAHRFTGKPRDAEATRDYFGARYYHAQVGEFAAVDPLVDVERSLSDPQLWNRYAYVRNNPMRFVDPDGRALETLWDLLNLARSAKAVWDNPRSVSNWGALGIDAGATLIPGAPAMGGILRIAGKSDDILEGGHRSFRSFKRAAGPAGPGMDWHHIVEKHSQNTREFGETQIHNIANLIRVDRNVHREITRFYASKQPFTGNLTFRDWLRGRSFDEQKKWGSAVLAMFVGSPK